MPLELVRERIVLNNQAGKQSSQLLLEGDLIVPDSKPDIDAVLRCGGEVRLDEGKVNEDRVNFTGEFMISILYQAKKSTKPFHSMVASLPIEDFIHMEGIDKDTAVTLDATVENMDCRLVNDRKISVKAVITVTAEAENVQEGEIVQEIKSAPIMQVMTGIMNVDNTVENKKDRFVIKEELALSSGKPNIGEILSTDVMISDKDVRAMDGRVLVRGNLKVSTLYIGDTDDSILEVMDHEIPFNGYIESKDVTGKMMARAKLAVENKEIRPMADEDGEDRILNCEITIVADMKVTDSQEIELIEDAYYPGKPLEISRKDIEYLHVVGRNKNQFVIKESVILDSKLDPMMQVYKVWATVVVDDVLVMDDVLEVQGVLNLEVLYIGQNDEEPIGIVKQSIPFNQEIELKGATKDHKAIVEAKIEDIAFNMLSDREVEVRATLGFDALVLEQKGGEIITNIDFYENEQVGPISTASAVIYVVQKGDSLWSIAKKYNTTLEDILLLNDIENPDRIFPGQKLLILKKITE